MKSIKALPGYRAVVEDIHDLLVAEDYNEDYRPPTADAVRCGEAFLAGALEQMESTFPVGQPIPDGDGGFRIHWVGHGKNLQLNVPASEELPISVFWRDGLEYSLDQAAGPPDLAARLTWFSGG